MTQSEFGKLFQRGDVSVGAGASQQGRRIRSRVPPISAGGQNIHPEPALLCKLTLHQNGQLVLLWPHPHHLRYLSRWELVVKQSPHHVTHLQSFIFSQETAEVPWSSSGKGRHATGVCWEWCPSMWTDATPVARPWSWPASPGCSTSCPSSRQRAISPTGHKAAASSSTSQWITPTERCRPSSQTWPAGQSGICDVDKELAGLKTRSRGCPWGRRIMWGSGRLPLCPLQRCPDPDAPTGGLPRQAEEPIWTLESMLPTQQHNCNSLFLSLSSLFVW